MTDRAGQRTHVAEPATDMARPAAASSRRTHGGRGNQEIQRRLRADAIQTKLAVSRPDDEHEREADHVAHQVLSHRDHEELVPQVLATAPPGVQRAADEQQEEKKKEEEAALAAPVVSKTGDKVARKAAGGDTPAVAAPPGGSGGRALPGPVRSFFEPRLGHDLSSVRVHDDAAGAAHARSLSARAFTYGRDIYFGAGRYNPSTPEGSFLLAHELVHTIQQRPGAPMIQRQTDPPQGGPAPAAQPPAGQAAAESSAPSVDATTLSPTTGRLDVSDANDPKIVFDKLGVPGFKLRDHRGEKYQARKPLKRRRNFQRGNTDQRNRWRQGVPGTPQVQDALRQKHEQGQGGAETAPSPRPLIFKAPSERGGMQQARYFIGDLPTVAQAVNLPSWDAQGGHHAYQVDHIVELQLANWNAEPWPNELPNMELLEASANTSSGSQIKTNIEHRITTFLQAARGDERVPRSMSGVKERFTLQFDDVEAQGDVEATIHYWTQTQIEAGEHLGPIQVAHEGELGREGEVRLFPDITGGVPKMFRWPARNLLAAERDWLRPFTITARSFEIEPGSEQNEVFGSLTIGVPATDPKWYMESGPEPVEVRRIPGARYAGYLNKTRVRSKLTGLRKKGASPIQLADSDVLPGGGLYIAGQILPDVPVLRGGIDFELRGDDLRVFKEFSTSEIAVPPPFQISDCTLVASAGTESGLALSGRVDFGIQRVGTGWIQAEASTTPGIEFAGQFDFDSRLFDPSWLSVAYREGSWSGSGELGIPPGKVPGVRRGTITASYAEGHLEASGNADLAIPGIQQAAMSLVYSETEGLTIGGTFSLSNDIPGIRGGTVRAQVRERETRDGYAISAEGEAQPAIPGIDTTLAIAYDDGALTISGRASFERGMMSGTITVGATNRPVDAEGNPVPGGTPTDELRSFGGGSATIRLTPWLQGTAGLRILPNGELELSGGIGLPAALNIFDEKSYERNIFTIGIDIPIVGVAAFGQRIGIFATIAGGLDLSAGIGPGQLRDVGLQITYNPAHEDETHITGGGTLHIPAHAGMRLFVRGGIGAGIPLVSASANLEIGGSVGLEGAVTANVQVDWMPGRGLVLDAAGEIFVEPKFRFDISGFVLVEAGAWGFTIELYSQRWQLAAFEHGSGLRLGVRFPIHYEEGQPFDVSWDDVEFVVPDVDPQQILRGLIGELV